MSIRANLQNKISLIINSNTYASYMFVRERVLDVIDKFMESDISMSEYWKEEVNGFDYLFDASPLIISKLREHTYHITGIKSYEYREHHSHMAEQFEKKYELINKIDPWGLFVEEAENLGGFGHKTKFGRINIDTLKFYETMVGMEISNCFSAIRGKNATVLEIGAGWGGFAYQFKKNFPRSTYVIVDLPQTMIFSYTYLSDCYPDAKLIFIKDAVQFNEVDITDYDFVFIPHVIFNDIEMSNIDLGINMVSFQEMTEKQVMSYLTKLKSIGCKLFYSHNRDKSKHNNEMSAVGICMKRIYKIQEIKILDYQYTDLKMNSISKISSKKKSIHDYRHIIGRC